MGFQMLKTNAKRLSRIMAILCVVSLATRANEKPNKSNQVIEATFDEIAKNPHKFHHKVVHVVANVSWNFEIQIIEDNPLSKENRKSFWFEVPATFESVPYETAYKQCANPDGCIQVSATGRIAVAKRTLNPKLHPKPIDGWSGFGHLNAYPIKFTILSCDKASSCK